MDNFAIQTALNTLGYGPIDVDGDIGRHTKLAVKRFQQRAGLNWDGVPGEQTQAALQRHLNALKVTVPAMNTPVASIQPILTASIIRKVCPFAKAPLVAAIADHPEKLFAVGVNDKLTSAHLLAQIATETGGLTSISENLNYTTAKRIYDVFKGPAANRRFKSVAECERYVRNPEALANKVYGGRMGNYLPNDGWNFRGGGMLQTTGRDNYTQAGYADNPQALREPDTALDAALTFWRDNNLNRFATKDDATGLRRAINGGTNGLDEMRSYLAKAKKALGI